MRISSAVPTFLLASLLSIPAWSAPIVTDLTLEVTQIAPGITDMALGDRFDLSFTIEDSRTDLSAPTDSGVFTELVTAWTMNADPGNAGSWTPGGAVDLPLGSYTSEALTDRILFEIGGAGFPDGGPTLEWIGFAALTDWIPGLTDTGAGQTFADQLGEPFGIPPGDFELRILFDVIGDRGAFSEVTLAVVPPDPPDPVIAIPTTSTVGLGLLAIALAAVAVRRLS